ncbi:diguanylate cyclase [Anaerorhabdus sp.]|jgi:diguanylate cyclase (GGDEF)-like protein/PAS domain S-box-containing protein|uniref:diguanylate cyclase n=1 Tax=Anaerorhabdus sp. TaxID=1872524 RepID=UPI002FC800AB
MGIEQRALNFVNDLKNTYYADRDLDNLLKCFDNDISWIGTGKDEYSYNLDEAKQALKNEINEYNGFFTVTETNLQCIKLSNTICLVYGHLIAIPDDSTLSEENVRVSIIIQEVEGKFKLVHMHFSHPDANQELGKFFISKLANLKGEAVRIELDSRIRELENFSSQVPGGAHQCLNDEFFTFKTYNDGFLSITGYSKEELTTLFDNKFINMIHPDDRARILKESKEQLKNSNDIEIEYRIIQKSGKPIWILDKGRLTKNENENSFYCILIEISDRKKSEEMLRLTLEKYEVISNQTTDVLFEWDLIEDDITFSNNFFLKFGYEPICENISKNFPITANVHPEDAKYFMKAMTDIKSGKLSIEEEFRIRNNNDSFIWCKIRSTTQFDEDKNPIKAIGLIVDIDEEKRQRQRLIDQAQRDSLTGLYNKVAINSLIQENIEHNHTSGLQALLIIDIDNFKHVNDTFGHLCGDKLLSDVSTVLRSKVRSTDLVGRIGGDEFIVYFPNVDTIETVEDKTQYLLENLSTLKPTDDTSNITCSIGISIYERGTIDYYTLFNHADEALYQRKENGRNGYTIYTKDDHTYASKSAIGADIISEKSIIPDNQRLSQYAMNILLASKDLENDLQRILEIIGQYYDVSRVYIHEANEEGNDSHITYEWAATGTPLLSSLHMPLVPNQMGDFLNMFNSEGILYCPDIIYTNPFFQQRLDALSVKSLLQYAIYDEDRFVGCIGFDECRKCRYLTNEEQMSFRLTATVLSQFLIKLRLKQQIKKLKDASIH